MDNVKAIIFAGGTGVRMGAELPKQFIEVEGRPIIIHTLDIFEKTSVIDEIFVACKEDYIEELTNLVKQFGISKVSKIVAGGTSALGSQYNALKAVKDAYSEQDEEEKIDDAIVLIHDGVRPCIDDKLIEEVVALAEEKGAVVTCTPMFETPVISKSGKIIEDIPKRADCYTAQAPQAFRLGELLEAHGSVREGNPGYEGFVDSGSLMINAGREVALLKGPRSNIKVTTPEDLYIFRAMLEFRKDQLQ